MADYKLVTISWLSGQGYTVLSTAEATYCPTYEEITGETKVTGASVSSTCSPTSAAYSNNQNVVEEDVYATPVGCSCDDFTLTETSLSFIAGGETKKVGTITTDCVATCSGVDWITINKDGTDVNLTASENTVTSSRSGTVKISVGDNECTSVTVSQDAQSETCPASGSVQITSSIGEGGAACIAVVAFKTDTSVFTANTFTFNPTPAAYGWQFCSSGDTWEGHTGYSLLKMTFSTNSAESARTFNVTHTGTMSDGTTCSSSYTITQSAATCQCSDFNVNGSATTVDCPVQGSVLAVFSHELPADGGLISGPVVFNRNNTAFTSIQSVTYDGTIITGATWGGTSPSAFPGDELVLAVSQNTGSSSRTGGKITITANRADGGTCTYTDSDFTQQNAVDARKVKVVVHLTGNVNVAPSFNFMSGNNVMLSVGSTAGGTGASATHTCTWVATGKTIDGLVIYGGGYTGSSWGNISIGETWNETTKTVSDNLMVSNESYNPNGYTFCSSGCDSVCTTFVNTSYVGTKEIHVRFNNAS